MKKPFPGVLPFVFWVVSFCFVFSSPAVPVLTIVPSNITNDYVGTVRIGVTGLSAGETLRIEKFFDANTNGIIDAGELLVQSFTVTDGQLPRIAGIRNLSVPGDDDSLTNGQVRVDLSYPALNHVLDHIAGKYLIKISDPTNGITPLIQSLTINQKVQSQGVTGTLTAADTGFPLSNAVVVLAQQDADGGGGTVTDAAGHYTLYAATTNNYSVVCIKPGFVSDQAAGSVTVSSNAFATKNLAIAAATTSANGKVSDSLSGIGLPGIFIQAEQNSGLFAAVFTDGNGNYNLPVTAGLWKVKLGGESGGSLLGYARQNNSINVNTTSGSVSNANFQLLKVTALVYGTVKDNLTNPVPLMSLFAQDSGNLFDAVGQSDTNGNYSVGVLGSSFLNIGPDNSSLAAAGFIGSGTTLSITNGEAVLQNFIVRRITAHLRGHVLDNSNNPVANIQLVVSPTTDTNGSGSIYPQTSNDGSFDAGIYGGSWRVALECQSGAEQNLVSPDLQFNVTDGVDQNNISVVAQIATAHVTGTVKDNNQNPLVGVNLFCNISLNGTLYSSGCATTDNSGNYQLPVFPGTWTVGINSADVNARGFLTVPNQNVSIAGTNNGVVNFIAQPFSNSPPTLSQPLISGNQFHFHLTGSAGRNYRIESSTNLTFWEILRTNAAIGGGFDFVDTNAPAFQRRYYRALLLQ
ncbi:MAG: regulator of chromosome condensation [Pedosphaera sp.]|nr:regulator of chromosome condensation [Pedosphaera sp.]